MNLNFSFQTKIRGDDFKGSYYNGLSLANSISVKNCKVKEYDEEKNVYECERYRITAYHKKAKGTYTCYTQFENLSDEDLTIDLLSSFCLDNIDADYIHRATSFNSAEGKLLSQNLSELNMDPCWSDCGLRIQKFGQIGSMPVRGYFPFVCLENRKKKQFVGVQIYCASSWQIEVIRIEDKLFTVTGGLADFDYGHWCKVIHSGDTFVSPKAVVAVGKTLLDVCNKLVKAQNPDISVLDRDMPVIFNEYCANWNYNSKENIEKLLPRLVGSGIKYFVIDAGWFKKPGVEEWWKVNGDWNDSRERYPNGIKEVADEIRSCGMIPGIWFEFEKAACCSDMYKKTEYLLYRDGVPLTVGVHHFLDMRKPEVQELLKEQVIDFMKEKGFGYIKIDYNDTIGVGCDGEESLGEGLRKSVLGTQAFIREIKREIPEVVIENCASGGHRLEPSMMEISSMASFSDAHECKCIPLIAANVQRMIRPEQSQIWAVLRPQDNIHRIRYSLAAGFLGRLCISGNIDAISERNWNEALKAIKFYNKCKKIIKNGVTTVIDTFLGDYNDPRGYQAVLREYGRDALLVVHTFKDGANPNLEQYFGGRKVVDVFGSNLDHDFRAKVFLLRK